MHSQYGIIKVFEWGPEDGKKVLLVHGLTTSSIAVGAMASELVERGCRVMTFDLWGHGYTDSCGDLDHDIRLYTSQILLAVTSSKLSWVGNTGFGLVGCSMGGAIAAAFAGYFPKMVDSLALIVPAGLIRRERLESQMRLLRLGTLLLPSVILEMLIMRRLTQPLFEDHKDNSPYQTGDGKNQLSQKEVKPCQRYPQVTVSGSMNWAMQNHKGFYTSFMSAAKHMHGSGQLERWRLLRDRPNRTLIVAGSKDPIIVSEELYEDAVEALGDNLDWKVLEGAHDITITRPKDIVDAICDSWQLEGTPKIQNRDAKELV
ncbi:hypothetical protein ONS96_004029 [Cadophora gregata f. sp. sojae]|nr:hypothetical protein ONS96_004029 [Cadophora gregata f. sp. sojae]